MKSLPLGSLYVELIDSFSKPKPPNEATEDEV